VASAGARELEKIIREIAVGLTCADPGLELPPKAIEAVEAGIEKWQDVDSTVEERLLNAVDEGVYLEYRRRSEKPDVAVLKDIEGIQELLSILNSKPEEIRLREKRLICWASKSRQDRLESRFSPKCFGRVNFKPGPVGGNWIRTDRMFVTVVGKDTDPSDLPRLVLNALSDWDPAPHRLLMSKMRAELDKKGGPVESEILSDSFLQAGWLEEFLDPDKSTGQIHVRNAVRRHWEAIGDKLEHEVADYALRLSGEVLRQNTLTVMRRFSKLDPEANRRDILLHLNCHNCSKPVEGTHLTIGHILRLEEDDTYKLCLSPACDLVPGQKGAAGFHKRLGDWMPFTAVSLSKVPEAGLSEALGKATAGNHLFVKVDGDPEIKVFKCIPNLSEPMFAANRGRFPDDGTRKMELVSRKHQYFIDKQNPICLCTEARSRSIFSLSGPLMFRSALNERLEETDDPEQALGTGRRHCRHHGPDHLIGRGLLRSLQCNAWMGRQSVGLGLPLLRMGPSLLRRLGLPLLQGLGSSLSWGLGLSILGRYPLSRLSRLSRRHRTGTGDPRVQLRQVVSAYSRADRRGSPFAFSPPIPTPCISPATSSIVWSNASRSSGSGSSGPGAANWAGTWSFLFMLFMPMQRQIIQP